MHRHFVHSQLLCLRHLEPKESFEPKRTRTLTQTIISVDRNDQESLCCLVPGRAKPNELVEFLLTDSSAEDESSHGTTADVRLTNKHKHKVNPTKQYKPCGRDSRWQVLDENVSDTFPPIVLRQSSLQTATWVLVARQTPMGGYPRVFHIEQTNFAQGFLRLPNFALSKLRGRTCTGETKKRTDSKSPPLVAHPLDRKCLR